MAAEERASRVGVAAVIGGSSLAVDPRAWSGDREAGRDLSGAGDERSLRDDQIVVETVLDALVQQHHQHWRGQGRRGRDVTDGTPVWVIVASRAAIQAVDARTVAVGCAVH